MSKSKLNIFIYAISLALIIFGLICLIVNFTVCSHAWIISAIILPIGTLMFLSNYLSKKHIAFKIKK